VRRREVQPHLVLRREKARVSLKHSIAEARPARRLERTDEIMVVASIMGSELLRFLLPLRPGVARVLMKADLDTVLVAEAGLEMPDCEKSPSGS